MKNILKINLVILSFILCCGQLIGQTENWLARAEFDIVATGTYLTKLPSRLHRLADDSDADLDLSLLGPDGNSRAFELFWRESSDVGIWQLKPEKVELLEDHRFLWHGNLPENYLFSSIEVDLPAFPAAGKLTFLGINGDQIATLGANIAVLKPSPNSSRGTASIEFQEASFEKIRIFIAGFDEKFAQTPVQSMVIRAKGRRSGNDYLRVAEELEFSQQEREEELEVRIKMPGNGILVDKLTIGTEALFQGTWTLGHEKITLGQSDFIQFNSGNIEGVDESPLNFEIPVGLNWNDATTIVVLKPKRYIGKITSVKGEFQLPYLTFAADMPGKYQLVTGRNQANPVNERPTSIVGDLLNLTEISKVEFNQKQQAEVVLQNLAVGGGPFKAEGYRWQAPLKIEKPGFYQLQLSSKAACDGNFAGLRIVHDGQQIPYFQGRVYEIEEKLSAGHQFNADENSSVYSLKFPDGKLAPVYLRVKTSGIFERNITLQKHVPGLVGWQDWKTMTIKNTENREIEFIVSMSGFPVDQKDLRLVVDHGSNQALEFSSISACYRTADLFFVAVKPGEYSLFGGNSQAGRANYDLAIIQNKLLKLFPEKITHGSLGELGSESATVQTTEKGGPFSSAGYTWVASVSVQLPGLTQLVLHHQASLDDSRDSIRIVKDGLQVPYFAGEPYGKTLAIEFSDNYNQDRNLSTVDLKLPVASKHWQNISFNIPGVFSRKIEAQLRKPGKLGWKKWKEFVWTGNDVQNNVFSLALIGFPKGETEIRLEIPHGDNSPLKISSVQARYSTRDLFFDATEAGEFFIYGGNSSARPPAYDLALIRNSMLKAEPHKVQMPEMSGHFKTDIGRQLENVFSERGYGLYLILGLVTLVLLVLIVKMFPEEAAAGSNAGDSSEPGQKQDKPEEKHQEKAEDKTEEKTEKKTENKTE